MHGFMSNFACTNCLGILPSPGGLRSLELTWDTIGFIAWPMVSSRLWYVHRMNDYISHASMHVHITT